MGIEFYLFGLLSILGVTTLLCLVAGDVRGRQRAVRHEWQKNRLESARALMAEIKAGLESIDPPAPEVKQSPAMAGLQIAVEEVPVELRQELKMLDAISRRAGEDPNTFSNAIRSLLSTSSRPVTSVFPETSPPVAKEAVG